MVERRRILYSSSYSPYSIDSFSLVCQQVYRLEPSGEFSLDANFLYECRMKNPMMSVADTFPNLDPPYLIYSYFSLSSLYSPTPFTYPSAPPLSPNSPTSIRPTLEDCFKNYFPH